MRSTAARASRTWVGVVVWCVVLAACSGTREKARTAGVLGDGDVRGAAECGAGRNRGKSAGVPCGEDGGGAEGGSSGGADRVGEDRAGDGEGTPEQEQRLQRMLAKAARARGLAAVAPVRLKVLRRDALGQIVRSHVGREVPAEVVRNQGEFFVGLGVVPPDSDFEGGVYRLIESQLAGFYEPHDKTMYLAADLGEEVAEATLAHELVHALQDQHFDLGSRLSFKPEGNDAASAVQSLAEGDATSAMIDVMGLGSGIGATDVPDEVVTAPLQGSMLAPELASVPMVLRASLVAPYVDGIGFVNGLRRAGGWDAVDGAWREAPETTEQVLHPEKYALREQAERVGVPAAPAQGRWLAVYGDVFGEQGLRIGLEAWLSRAAAAKASEGWAGDRAVLYREVERQDGNSRKVDGEGVFALAWRVRFDPSAGTGEGALAERTLGVVRGAFGRNGQRIGSVWCWDRGAGVPILAARSKRDFVIAVGPYEHRRGVVRARASCAQSAVWVADIVSGRGT